MVFILSGCAAPTPPEGGLPRALPEAVGPATIYSLGSAYEIDEHPYYDDIDSKDLESFERYQKIIDMASVTAVSDVQSYIEVVNRALGEPDEFALCFEPRHAITYPSIYGDVTTLICFECNKALITIDGWVKSVHFVSKPRLQLEAIYDKYHVRKPVDP
jgi:hypothetical protein